VGRALGSRPCGRGVVQSSGPACEYHGRMDWADVGINSGPKVMQVRDLWKHEYMGVRVGNVTAMVDSHDVIALRLSPAFLSRL
jgi:hypothetical protein